MDDTSSTSSRTASEIPPDDPRRNLAIARPNEDQKLPHIGLVGDTYTILLKGEDTAGLYCLIDMHIPPGGGPPPHRHDFEEMFSVLEGRIELTFRGEKLTVRAGETLNIPANAPHSFTNASDRPARLLCVCTPPGQERFFEEVGVPVEGRTTTPPELGEDEQAAFLEKAQELAPKYRTELLGPERCCGHARAGVAASRCLTDPRSERMTSTTRPTVLAVGAAGPSAGLVVPELARRGARVRGLIRDASQEKAVRKNGAAEVAVGDLRDRAGLDAALEGVDAVFYIAPAFMPDEAAVGKGVVDAAKRAGVRRFVFSSVIDPVIGALENHIGKAPVEEAIIESGMAYAILQPTLFFQNLAGSWPRVVETGAFAEPWSAETRFSRVDYREVAAIALTEDRLLYGTYQLCAEGILDRHDVATLMGGVLGREVRAERLDPDRISLGGDGGRPSPMRRMFEWYDDRGLRGNALVLRAILGREPRTLRAYLEELAAGPRPAG